MNSYLDEITGWPGDTLSWSVNLICSPLRDVIETAENILVLQCLKVA